MYLDTGVFLHLGVVEAFGSWEFSFGLAGFKVEGADSEESDGNSIYVTRAQIVVEHHHHLFVTSKPPHDNMNHIFKSSPYNKKP